MLRSDDRRAPEPAEADGDEKIRTALDPEMPLAQRVRALWWLGRLGSDEAVDVIEHVLHSDARAAVRAAAAHALGFSRHEAVRHILEPLLQSPEVVVARGAIRGLAATGDPQFVGVLEELLRDPAQPDIVRAQAAASLPDLSGSKARQYLLAAFREVESDEVAQSVLEGLGKLPFEENASFFAAVLDDDQLSDEIKSATLDALGQSTPDAAGLLLEVAAGASSPRLRSGAVEALAFLEDAPNRPRALLELLTYEAEPDVRAELYNTLALDAREAPTQAAAEQVFSWVLSETNPDARLEGVRLAAYLLSGDPRKHLVEPFEGELVPWLMEQATTSENRYRRLVAVEALNVAGTSESRNALALLSREEDVEVAAAAARLIAPGD